MNIRKTIGLLSLCVCSLVGGNAYGQDIINHWQSETWAYSDNKGETSNHYIYSPNLNCFLKYESEGTNKPYEATKFTITHTGHDYGVDFTGNNGNIKRRWYDISFQNGRNNTLYVYESDGVAQWGETHEKQWCIQDFSNNNYRIWQFDPEHATKARSIYLISDGGAIPNYTVSYEQRDWFQTGAYAGVNFISEAQYNALYPGTYFKEILNYSNISSTGWDNPDNHTVSSYKAYDGTWLAQTSTTGTGVKLQLKVTGLLNKTYNLKLNAYATATAYVSNAVKITANNQSNSINTHSVDPAVGTGLKLLSFDGVAVTDGTLTITLDVQDIEGLKVNTLYASINSIDFNEVFGVDEIVSGTEYYMYNGGTGKYLEGANAWGTQATVANHGIEIIPVKLANGKYQLKTGLQADVKDSKGNITGHTDGYYWSSPAYWEHTGWDPKDYLDGSSDISEFTISGTGNFTITTQKKYKYGTDRIPDYHTYYLTADASTNLVETKSESANGDYSKWIFRTFEQRIEEMKRATVDNPKDATFCIKDPDFSRNDNIRFQKWKGVTSNMSKNDAKNWENDSYYKTYNQNCNLQINERTEGGVKVADFDVYQELENLPEGLYQLTAYGYHYDSNELNPVFEIYANDKNAQMSCGTAINDPQAARTAFESNGGDNIYKNCVLVTVGSDGKLKIGARSNAKDGNTWIDNFELTYFGIQNEDNTDVTTLFLTNPNFQGVSGQSDWKYGWTLNGYSKCIGNNQGSTQNTYQGHGNFCDNAIASGTISEAAVYQKIYLSAGGYRMSALCVAQNNPGYLFVKLGDYNTGSPSDMGQHVVFIDNKADATYREVKPQTRTLQFVMPESGWVTVGYRNAKKVNCPAFTWNAVDNFKIEYLGDAKGTDISCQLVNSEFISTNEGLDTSEFGWQILPNRTYQDSKGTTKNVFNYEDFHDKTYGVAQIYNGEQDVNQTITGLPDGWYEIELQGFYRDANTAGGSKGRRNAFLYANRTYSQIQLITSIPAEAEGGFYFIDGKEHSKNGYPHDLTAAKKAFERDHDNYSGNTVVARVTNGTLKIGILREADVITYGADWTAINNVHLKYLHRDADITENMEFTQFIKNPSFESSDLRGWSGSKYATVADNNGEAILINGDGRYIADAGSTDKLAYYHLSQNISGTPNGLAKGTYKLTAKVTSVEDNDIAVFVNGRLGSFITTGSSTAKEIELGQIGVNDNEAFDITFTSNYGFKLDQVRLFRSAKEGSGDALIVDLDGLIAQAKAILESGFVGSGAFQIDGTALKKAYDDAVAINANETAPYLDKKAAKDALVAAITAIQTATPKQPEPQDIYMIKHIASGFYLTTQEDKVFITNSPSKVQFANATNCAEDGCTRYILSNSLNTGKEYINNVENSLSTNASEGVPTAFRIIFINGVPSHIALTRDHFKDGTCYGTQTISSGSDLFSNTDATDGYSRWIISTWQDLEPSSAEKKYLYNVEAGAFLGAGKVDTNWNTQACMNYQEGTDNQYVIIPWTVETDAATNLSKLKQNVRVNSGTYLKFTDSFPFVDGKENNEFVLTKVNANGVYTIGINPAHQKYGKTATGGETLIGWSGESNYMTLMPYIYKDDLELRGTSWVFYPEVEYKNCKKNVAAAHDARMKAWLVYRSAKREHVDTKDFELVYNSPYSTATAINLAAEDLKAAINERLINAPYKGIAEISYMVSDMDCQEATLENGGWVNTGFQHQEYDHGQRGVNSLYKNGQIVLGRAFYETWSADNVSNKDIHKTISGLPAGTYILQADVNAVQQSSPTSDVTGVILYTTVNGVTKEANVSAEHRVNGMSGLATFAVEYVKVAPGESLTIGLKTTTTNANWVAVDNFKLYLFEPYRKVESSTANDITTFKFKGYWRGTENAEASKYINDKATENKNKDEAMSVVDMTEATIVNDMDLSFTGPKTGNVLVWTAADAPVTINGKDQNVIKDGKCTKFVITDNQTLNIPKAFKANEVEYTRKFATKTTKYSYATVLLPFALETNDDYQFYSLDHGNADGSFYIVREASSTAGIPSFVRKKNSSADDVTFKKVSVNCDIDVLTTAGAHEVESTDPDDNLKLVGSYVYGKTMGTLNVVNTHAANNYYYIKNDQFWRGNDWFYVDAFRAYIDATNSPSNVRACSTFNLIEWEMPEVDAIEDVVETDAKIVGYYSANGAPRQCLQSGLNIVKFSDGHTKKVYVK